jgi:hypothetical protein
MKSLFAIALLLFSAFLVFNTQPLHSETVGSKEASVGSDIRPASELLASLKSKADSGSQRQFTTPEPQVAQQSCSTTCNGSNYNARCSSGQSCDCSCTRQPVCQCR